MKIVDYNIEGLQSLRQVLLQMEQSTYSIPLKVLSGASIGAHVRHVLEFYVCLLTRKGNQFSYDDRERNIQLETSCRLAIIAIDGICSMLEKIDGDHPVALTLDFSINCDGKLPLESTLYRELAYCLEHTIHHEALIKIGIENGTDIGPVTKTFGVAASTLRYKNGN